MDQTRLVTADYDILQYSPTFNTNNDIEHIKTKNPSTKWESTNPSKIITIKLKLKQNSVIKKIYIVNNCTIQIRIQGYNEEGSVVKTDLLSPHEITLL